MPSGAGEVSLEALNDQLSTASSSRFREHDSVTIKGDTLVKDAAGAIVKVRHRAFPSNPRLAAAPPEAKASMFETHHDNPDLVGAVL